jgi:hypothetical protein
MNDEFRRIRKGAVALGTLLRHFRAGIEERGRRFIQYSRSQGSRFEPGTFRKRNSGATESAEIFGKSNDYGRW